MGIVIWYKLAFPGVTVSNDIFGGDYILDADITLEMTAGDSADTFKATLVNLPADVVQTLKSKQSKESPLTVTIFLGYFENPSQRLGLTPVMNGVVRRLQTRVGDDGSLITEINGQEAGGYRLLTLNYAKGLKGTAQVNDIVKAIGTQATVSVKNVPSGLGTVTDLTTQGNALDALRQIAQRAAVPLVVRDEAIFMGALIGSDKTPASFAPDTNIVSLDRQQATEDEDDPATWPVSGQIPTPTRTSLNVTVLGDPDLRVGQTVLLRTADPADNIAGPLRINHLKQVFSSKSGYTCTVTVVAAQPSEASTAASGAHSFVNRFRDVIETRAVRNPGTDVGEITAYDPGKNQTHVATLNYGQAPPADEVAPSVNVEVPSTVQLHNKPVASPFAWHKVGLIVPVYPGMRALLAHNRGLVNDAVVTGFLWAEKPKADRPKNEPGDYWLSLPTKLTNKLPDGAGVHDLIDKDGMRVIECKALRVFIADQKLTTVGDRPTVPSTAKTLSIEHESGTTIAIDDSGKVTITTDQKDISLTTGKATLTLGGSGAITLNGSSITFDASTVEVK
ncbi:MAG TPA: hypothetical protein VJT14_04385 [Candidatus Dormibacteraeota bacterium]|nr:hypothetical protein [Candidatus Dormibacteraeota bacterium]